MAKPVGAREKLRLFLIEHVGEVIDSDTLRAVAGTSEWARRIRELRDEYGYQVRTHNDRAGLRPGEYVLVSAEPHPITLARSISKELRAQVLSRNGYTCQMCGIGAGEPHPDDNGRPARLHIGHIIDISAGGGNESSNLRALCSVCNEGASNITASPPAATKILAQLRRAARDDQLLVLKWLIDKYPNEIGESR